MSLKLEHHSNQNATQISLKLNVTQIRISLKLECYSWIVTQLGTSLKLKRHSNCNVTQLECHSILNVTQFGRLNRLKGCKFQDLKQRIYRSSFDLVKISGRNYFFENLLYVSQESLWGPKFLVELQNKVVPTFQLSTHVGEGTCRPWIIPQNQKS